MAGAASAVSLIVALILAAWRPRRVSPVVVLFALGLANLALAAAMGARMERVLEAVRLHPILALALGLMLGGMLDRAGGLSTLAAASRGLGRTPLGGAGVLVLVVFLPLVLCLPCGHLIAAALAPVLPALCPEEGRAASAGVLAAAFARTAYGSCGPAPAGGIGMICEGWLAQGWPAYAEGALRAPQIAALVLAVPAAAWVARRAGAVGPPSLLLPTEATARGAVALLVFAAALVVALLRPFGRWEIEVPLAAGGLVLWPLAASGESRYTPRAAWDALSPLIGVVTSFYAVGAVAAAGGLDAIGAALRALPDAARWGAVAAIVLTPSIVPLPCGRTLGFTLAPVLYELGPAKGGPLAWTEVAVGMAALATTLSMTCAHSPFCGGGMVVAHRAGASRVLRSLAASLIVAVPCAALAAVPTIPTAAWVAALAALGAVSGTLLAPMAGFAGATPRFQGAAGGLLGGALAGATLWVR